MNQRGVGVLALLIGIIIIVSIAGGAYYMGTRRTALPQSQAQNPIVISQTSQLTVTPSSSPAALQTDKIYLINNLNDDNEAIFLDAPTNAEVKPQNEVGYITSEVKVNKSLYSVSSQAGGRGGPCPMGEVETKCGYTDDKIDVKSPLKIAAVRVWKDEKGVFLINPWDIYVGNRGINSILITKLKPNEVFSENEVIMWKQLLVTIELH